MVPSKFFMLASTWEDIRCTVNYLPHKLLQLLELEWPVIFHGFRRADGVDEHHALLSVAVRGGQERGRDGANVGHVCKCSTAVYVCEDAPE
jgi:hypothetical protein